MLKYIKIELLLVILDQISLFIVFSAHFVAHKKFRFFHEKQRASLILFLGYM